MFFIQNNYYLGIYTIFDQTPNILPRFKNRNLEELKSPFFPFVHLVLYL
jgi:hypothetical protein